MGLRVHELAKELKLTSKELIDKLKLMNIEVKSHASSIDDALAEKVRQALMPKKEMPAKAAVVKEPPQKVKPEQKPAAVTGQEEAVKKKEEEPSAEKKIEEPPRAIAAAQKELRKLVLDLPVGVKALAEKLNISASELIKSLISKGIFATINQQLDEETAKLIAAEHGYELERSPDEEELVFKEEADDPAKLRPRPPVVTLMGHVDHGKTSLLDAVRKTDVAAREAGGITQHIGAYEVILPKGKVTFLDTPGHEAFTAMRARGANVTDIVVLVVAADDGVMPQTVEAADHAKAADVPMVVAINKIDKPTANVDRVKKQLMEQLGLTPEDWGGKTIMVGVSAKTGTGVEDLLEMLLLEAEMLELKANPTRPARGVVIEAKLSKASGSVTTVLVQNGKLSVGDVVVAGGTFGKVRAMINDKGKRVSEVLPGSAVEILGLSGVPHAGDVFYVISDERKARDIVARRQDMKWQKKVAAAKKITLEDLYNQIKEGKLRELNVILKADVQGSLEAIRDSLMKLPQDLVAIKFIHEGIGDITEPDIMLAAASNAVVIGFHVDMTPEAKQASEIEKVEVKIYNIIYEVVSDIRAAMEGLLEPKTKEVFVGRAEVRKVFKVSRAGTIAGSFVTKGKIRRADVARLLRAGEVIFEGKLSSLKRFKDDVKEVQENFECGIGLAGFNDIQEGDIIEVYELEKIAQKL